MKAQILKIAGVSNEKEFYKKFPTEESFMAKHGKTLKKAQNGYNTPGIVEGFGMNPNAQYSNAFPIPGMVDDGSIYNPALSSGLPTYNPNSDINYTIGQNQQTIGATPTKDAGGFQDMFSKGLPIIGGIAGGLSALEAEKSARDQARQAKKVSEITLQASATRPEQIERRYVRPEDNVFATNQLFPANGVGTNVLAKDGVSLESYQNGGGVFDQFGQNPYGNLAGSFFDNNAGSQIGGAIGSAFGPLGGVAGSVIGGALDTNGRKMKKDQEATQRNIMNMALNNAAPGIQAGYASHLQDGGTLSDSGELQTHWGGEVEPISYNPFLPDGGETVMFRGKSHDDGGIGVTFGGSPVEVERGEPAVKLGSSGDLTVFGNLTISKPMSELLEDKNASGKKFKNYVADLSKHEAKQNKLVNTSTKILDELDVKTPFDKLKLSSLQANMTGANMKLKSIAEKKTNAALLQDAINETSVEKKLVADSLSKGEIKKAEEGVTTGTQTTVPPVLDEERYGLDPWKGNEFGLGKATASLYTKQQWNQIADELGFKGKGNKAFQEFLLSNPESAPLIKANHNNLYKKDPFIDEKLGYGWSAAGLLKNQTAATPAAAPVASDANHSFDVTPYKRNGLADVFNEVLPYFRPTDQENLDASQLYGEMYALSNNQVDPVQAQTYQPDLGTPYDVSYQDQLNANQSDYRAISRMTGYNPAAQAALNAQKYSANEKVLGEQFRANQAMKDKVYGENRNILNDAKLKNLSIYDQQYTRQSQAVSNSKATTQSALNSISDKYSKNKLENRTLGVYENLYNYRYDAAGRAVNLNPLFQPNIPQFYSPGDNPDYVPVYDAKGNITGYKPKDATPGIVADGSRKTARNGAILNAYRNL